MKSAESILLPLQLEQLEHDRLAHSDILNLDTQTRLKHMALHFLKYAGKIVCAKESEDQAALSAVVTDTLIICLATANALNVSVGATLDLRADSLPALCARLSTSSSKLNVFDTALMDLLKIGGGMAKAIESTDHLERGNPREFLESAIVDLTFAMLAVAGRLHLKLPDTIRVRWRNVESKSIFRRTPKP